MGENTFCALCRQADFSANSPSTTESCTPPIGSRNKSGIILTNGKFFIFRNGSLHSGTKHGEQRLSPESAKSQLATLMLAES